MPSLSTWC